MEKFKLPYEGWSHKAKTIDKMLHDVCFDCLMANDPDGSISIESRFENVTLISESCNMDFDVGKELSLNIGRWSRLVKEYISKPAIDLFIRQCQEIINHESREGASTEMRFKSPIRTPKKHRWGGCLLAATFYGDWNGKPTLTFFSRTTYMGYIGMLDAAIAHVIARKITEDFDDANESSIRFVWNITSMLFHHFKVMPYLFTRSIVDKRMHRLFEINHGIHVPPKDAVINWWQRLLLDNEKYGVFMLDHEKYGPWKRVKRRYLEHIGELNTNIPPSLKVQKLDFSRAE